MATITERLRAIGKKDLADKMEANRAVPRTTQELDTRRRQVSRQREEMKKDPTISYSEALRRVLNSEPEPVLVPETVIPATPIVEEREDYSVNQTPIQTSDLGLNYDYSSPQEDLVAENQVTYLPDMMKTYLKAGRGNVVTGEEQETPIQYRGRTKQVKSSN